MVHNSFNLTLLFLVECERFWAYPLFNLFWGSWMHACKISSHMCCIFVLERVLWHILGFLCELHLFAKYILIQEFFCSEPGMVCWVSDCLSEVDQFPGAGRWGGFLGQFRSVELLVCASGSSLPGSSWCC